MSSLPCRSGSGATGAKVCIVFEGLDSAGKGGTIRRITERTSPRVFKHIALPTPTEREKSQMYIQRYIAHFPSAGEVAIFDRSWYNRAGVEPVMGYCTQEQTQRFLDMTPAVEKAMVDNDIILIGYWLNVSVEEQTRRLSNRITDPRKIWKLSPTDLKSYSKHYDYCRARDAMLAATDTSWAPWFVVDNDDKKRGRLNIISHLLSQIPYEPLPPSDVKMPRKPSPPRLRAVRGSPAAPHPYAVLGPPVPTAHTAEGLQSASDSTVRPQDSSAPATTQWYAMSAQDVAEKLGSIPIRAVRCRCFGLLQKNGPNALPAESPPPGWKMFLAQYKSHADHPGGRRGRVDRDRRDIHRHSGPADHSFERTGECVSRARPRVR